MFLADPAFTPLGFEEREIEASAGGAESDEHEWQGIADRLGAGPEFCHYTRMRISQARRSAWRYHGDIRQLDESDRCTAASVQPKHFERNRAALDGRRKPPQGPRHHERRIRDGRQMADRQRGDRNQCGPQIGWRGAASEPFI